MQRCIRTNDLDEVGDGTHLSSFQMLGNFSFGNGDYHRWIDMWVRILTELGVWKRCSVHLHPDSTTHWQLWEPYGRPLVEDRECQWSDGTIGGYCCEVYLGDLEIGNLVNPLGHSTDVGFGWERLLQVVEGKSRVDQTSEFDPQLSPVVRDHVRTLSWLKSMHIRPGNKGRSYLCRKLVRRILQLEPQLRYPGLEDYLESEHRKLFEVIRQGKRLWRKHQDKSNDWWLESIGITKNDLLPFLS